MHQHLTEDVIENLYENRKSFVEENLDMYRDELSTSNKESIKRWLDTDDEHKNIKKIKDKLKISLHDHRDIVKKQRNLMKDAQRDAQRNADKKTIKIFPFKQCQLNSKI